MYNEEEEGVRRSGKQLVWEYNYTTLKATLLSQLSPGHLQQLQELCTHSLAHTL